MAYENTITENLNDVVGVVKSILICLDGEQPDEHLDHYDCKEDIDIAIERLQTVREQL